MTNSNISKLTDQIKMNVKMSHFKANNKFSLKKTVNFSQSNNILTTFPKTFPKNESNPNLFKKKYTDSRNIKKSFTYFSLAF